MLTGFSAYLRPRLLTSLLTRQLQVPSGPFLLFRIWQHPQDQLTLCKTGRWDEMLDPDTMSATFLAAFWRVLATGAAFAPHWKASHPDLLHLFMPKSILDFATEVKLRDLLPRVFNFPQETREMLLRHGLQ